MNNEEGDFFFGVHIICNKSSFVRIWLHYYFTKSRHIPVNLDFIITIFGRNLSPFLCILDFIFFYTRFHYYYYWITLVAILDSNVVIIGLIKFQFRYYWIPISLLLDSNFVNIGFQFFHYWNPISKFGLLDFNFNILELLFCYFLILSHKSSGR